MGKFLYPESWSGLSLAPSARSELIGYVGYVARWNEKASRVKTNGADNIIGFFYDTYQAHEGACNLVGLILFSDEVDYFDRFFKKFDRFVVEWERSEGNLDRLHEATIPTDVIEQAEALLRKLEERGVSIWQE